ncbi:hypothetical protein QSJ19_12540 [Gordonia sp. ABSL11-1]|uniref:hypothetical protein n=1 Tax=Gordonia sp. ABSL11-1 TaxID=3053924 RepID=UPI0025727CDC|nr:hypothetical protein [Gordonia sp. ABSL11-1]MDL9946408.1 hypothetical protein [Gordonia sp. ABSL11-1]
MRWFLPAFLTNDHSALLPASAESTEVNDMLGGFSDTDSVPGLIIAERRSGLTPADTAFLTESTGWRGPRVSPISSRHPSRPLRRRQRVTDLDHLRPVAG